MSLKLFFHVLNEHWIIKVNVFAERLIYWHYGI